MNASTLRPRCSIAKNSNSVGKPWTNGKIVNWTRSSPYTRLHVPLGVSYDADPGRAGQILESVAARTPNVEQSPSPEVWFSGYGGSSLNFELPAWINLRTVQGSKVANDLYFDVFAAFKEVESKFHFPSAIFTSVPSKGCWLSTMLIACFEGCAKAIS